MIRLNVDICDVRQAALYLGVSEGRVQQLCREGKLYARKVSGFVWIIDRLSLVEYKERTQRERARTGE